ncbi:SOUL family heme-binding protein [Haloarcula pelagica]|uniref:SOUL family heme-binding protein n=1 Tax=Haloarcula pelagica TaxID=3033389 RepID=UPI0024C36720|nr:heme-binding protein [Halomicroarcula sp. YJ-61-S]
MGRFRALVATGVAALALWIGWGLYVARSAESVPYEVQATLDGVEIRRYPETVLVETTAPDAGAAFQRLFRYISGANAREEAVAMTAPVVTGASAPAPGPTDGESIPMTTPVRTDRDETGVTMAFFLPSDYTPATAPVPTDDAVRLVVEPARTVAVTSFSWYATEDRVERARSTLDRVLSDAGVTARGEPSLLQYDDPWTPPFMRTNEVAVRVDAETVPA